MSLIDKINKIFIGKPNEEMSVESDRQETNNIITTTNQKMMNNNTDNPFEENIKEETQSPSFNFESKPNNEANPFENIAEPVEEESLVEKFKRLSSRDTNFIFLFGRPATGKSYITASLIYYMQTSKLGTLHVSGTNSRDAELLVEDMYKNFHSGKILDRTNRNEPPYEIDLVFTPKDRRLPEMKITFLEMSGENLKQVQILKNDPNSGKLPDNIDTFLMCSNIRLIFFLVADHETASQDSITINKFLDYVFNKDKRFDNSNYLLAITKWDTYKGKFRNNVERFTETVMPNIHNRLIKEHLGNAITHYSIGEILRKEDKGVVIDQIKEVNTSRAEAVTNWLYKTITKKSLIPEPTSWEKLKDFFGL